MALLARRGFVSEAVALSTLAPSTLAATRIADARGSTTRAQYPLRRRHQASLPLLALVAAAAGVAAWLVPWPW